MITRRSFVRLTGGALAATPGLLAKEGVPSALDHVLLGCNDLERGIDFIEQHLGVRAVFGGVHPGRGTQNALLSLGDRRYLEIIAPDPKQKELGWHSEIARLTEPRLAGWAAHVSDIDELSSRLRKAGILFQGPQPGSRRRPDGRMLSWKTLTLADDRGGLLPFFIQWGADSLHPSIDAPAGCSLVHFNAVALASDGLDRITTLIEIDLPVAKGEKRQLRATFSGKRGEFSITN